MGKLSNRDVDAMTEMVYEDALADEEPWAIDSYEYRKAAIAADRMIATPPSEQT